LNPQTRRRIEDAVEQVADELRDRYEAPIRANPGMKLIDITRTEDPMSLWFVYGLIVDTRRFRWLTVLIILTAVLAGLSSSVTPNERLATCFRSSIADGGCPLWSWTFLVSPRESWRARSVSTTIGTEPRRA